MKQQIEELIKEAEDAENKLRKFVWVGYNKHFNQFWVSEPLTSRTLLHGAYPSFFGLKNDNCIFYMEIFEGDTLTYHTKTSMSDMVVKNRDNVFVGEGPFNTLALEEYFNASDFEKMEMSSSLA